MNIDLVICWFDIDDPDYRTSREFYLKSFSYVNNDTKIINSAFRDKSSLRYFLRSIEQHAKFINNIFIVTNGQLPDWLDCANNKIRLVSHKSIIPEEFLPTFNISAIESCFVNIPDLSDYFIYVDDNVFLSKDINKSLFFNEKNFPLVRLKKFVHSNKELQKIDNLSIKHTIDIMYKYCGVKTRFFEHCAIQACYKPDIIDCIAKFDKEFKQLFQEKFQTENSINKAIWMYCSYFAGHATLRYPHFFYVLPNWIKKLINPIYNLVKETHAISLSDKNYKVPEKTKMFWFEYDDFHTDNDLKRALVFLENYFPRKSSFEK